MAFEFTAADSVAENFARASREQLDRAVQALTDEVQTDPVSAIHAARKAIKKQRALLRMVRGSLPRRQRRSANTTLRKAAQRLSGFRDAEVMLQTLDRLAERFAGQLPEATFTAVREQLERTRDTQTADGQPDLIAATVKDLEAVRDDANHWTLGDDSWSAIEAGVLRTYRDGRKASRRSRKKPSLETRHEWRKRVKDGWYELRLLAPVCGPAARGQAEEAEQLAELLGAEHDLGMLKKNLKRVAPEVAVDIDAVIGLVDFRRDQLRTQASLIGKRMYAEGPTLFGRRLRRYWRAGRAEYQAFQERHPAALAEATAGR